MSWIHIESDSATWRGAKWSELQPADPYTPDVIRNLRDKPQSHRAHRIYEKEVKVFDRGRGEWVAIADPISIDVMPNLPNDLHFAPGIFVTINPKRAMQTCPRCARGICNKHGLRAGYPLAILRKGFVMFAEPTLANE